jgi:multiple sugar transport system substrate-binding protein
MRLRATAATLTLLCLTACGGESGSSGPPELRMTVWTANQAHLTLFDEIGAAYVAAHPDRASKITFDPLPFERYVTTLTTQLAGGKGPDLAWLPESAALDFVEAGALVPLDDVLEEPEGLNPATLKLWQTGGRTFAYPFSNSPFGIFVNKDLLAAAGQSPPADGWTWEQAVSAAAAVHATTGRAGLVVRDFDYKIWDNLATMWTGWGAQAWSEDGKTCGFDQAPMVDFMTFLHRAIFTDAALPGPGTTADFFAGQAGMTISQISRASLLDGSFAWDLVPLPAGPAGKYSVIGQGGVGVLRRGAHADEAADFLAFFTNSANSVKLAAFFPPPRTKLLTADTLAKANPKLSPAQLQGVVIDGIANGVVKPSHTGNAQLTQEVRAELDPLWEPDADVRAVLAGVCDTIDPLLAR